MTPEFIKMVEGGRKVDEFALFMHNQVAGTDKDYNAF